MPNSSSRNKLLHLTKEATESKLMLNSKSSSIVKHVASRKVSLQKEEKLPISKMKISSQTEESPRQGSVLTKVPYLQPPTTKLPKRHHHHRKKTKETNDLHRDIAFKKIRFFNAPPEPEPFTLCFAYPGTDLSHKAILDGIKQSKYVSIENIKNIQFIDMNVVLGSADVDNRWLIRVQDADTRFELLREGIMIDGERINLRRYDDINDEEYKAYQKRKSILQSDEHSEIQRLLANSMV